MRQLPRHDQPVVPDEGLPRRQDALLAVGRQRELRRAGMSAVQGPFGLAVADDEDAGGCHSSCPQSLDSGDR